MNYFIEANALGKIFMCSRLVEDIELIKPVMDGNAIYPIDEYINCGEYYFYQSALHKIPTAPSIHHTFDYLTKTWIDPRTMNDFKTAKWAEIKQARDTAEFGPFEWSGSVFDGDALSQQRIQGLVQMASFSPNMTMDWTLADNTIRTLTAVDAQALGLALAAHVNTQHVRARALRLQIEAATTPEAVQALVWEA